MGGLLRRAMRGSVGVLAVFFCVLCFVVPAKAFAADAPTASYDASTHEATISHAGENGDLFTNFKGLMPGDERDQDVNVQVGNARGTVRVYVQAFVNDASANVLDGVSLSARCGNDVVVGDGPVASVFSQPVRIATFDKPGDETVRLHLSVPVSIGNEAADASCDVKWIVTFEDESGEYTASDSSGGGSLGGGLSGGASSGDILGSVFSKTNDQARFMVIIAAALVATCAAAIGISHRREGRYGKR